MRVTSRSGTMARSPFRSVRRWHGCGGIALRPWSSGVRSWGRSPSARSRLRADRRVDRPSSRRVDRSSDRPSSRRVDRSTSRLADRLADPSASQRHTGIEVVDRHAGGGAVLVGPWMLGVSVVLPLTHRAIHGRPVAASYDWFGHALATALREHGVAARAATESDARKAPAGLEWACFAGVTVNEVLVDRRKTRGPRAAPHPPRRPVRGRSPRGAGRRGPCSVP